MADSDADLGAWSDERQALEQTSLSGRGSDADAPDPLRFGRAVMQLVIRRERDPDAEYDRPAAFVLTPGAWFEQAPQSAHRDPLLNTGHHRLTGKVHFVNVVATGRSMEYAGDGEELFEAIEGAGARSFPTLVYSPKLGLSTLSWYPRGIEDETSLELWTVAEVLPTVELITEVVSRVHTEDLITPDQASKSDHVWEDPAKGWAREDAEAKVQRAIRLAFLGAFLRCTIRAEQPGKDGRTDLEIVDDSGKHDQVVHHAVLELKVLREMGSTGIKVSDNAIAKHMRDGLEQAHSYGESRNFQERMLCCFDMRATNAGAEAVFAPLKDDAAQLGVHLRHWFLYRSSAHWRKCSVAQALTAAKTPPNPH